MSLFEHTNEFIERENLSPANTFTLGHNKFSTWSQQEFDRLNGSRNEAPKQPIEQMFSGVSTAATVDWRDTGAVQPV